MAGRIPAPVRRSIAVAGGSFFVVLALLLNALLWLNATSLRGTVNAADAVGLQAAIEYVKSVGFEQMHRQEVALTRRTMDGIRGIPSVHVLGSENPEEHCGIITFTVDGVHPHDISEIMASDGVNIRAGHHCAQPLLAHLGLNATARASFAFYNTDEDVDRFLESLSTLRERMGYGK